MSTSSFSYLYSNLNCSHMSQTVAHLLTSCVLLSTLNILYFTLYFFVHLGDMNHARIPLRCSARARAEESF